MCRRILVTTLLLVCGFMATALKLSAADSMRLTVANLTQDVASLSQEVRALRLEVEELQRENRMLNSALNSAPVQQQIAQLANLLQDLRREYKAADESQKRMILKAVNRQLEALSVQMQTALESVAQAVDSQPKIETPVRFSQDYPQTGITYVVVSGDTLSGIARKHGSTVKYIQNANKITNPSRDLQVGQSIFIPIKQP